MRNAQIGAAVVFVGFVCGMASAPAHAQAWIDAAELGNKKPDWVDAKYYQPIAPEPARATVWVEPVCRIVTRRIWHEPVYQTVCDRIWTDGHFETRRITQYDPCGCPVVREERLWIPGHYTTSPRQVLLTPGYWEMVEATEIVTPGYWKTLGDVN